MAPLVAAIKKARKSIDIVIFRFDRAEIEAALQAAAKRGVSVSALITYTNHGGEKSLRKLEMRLLDAGATVSRTADDLVRYHDKLLIVDRRVLYVLSFNFTHLDIDHSRGFGIVTRKGKLVQSLEAARGRQRPDALCRRSRQLRGQPGQRAPAIARLIGRAKKELLVYDPKIDDAEMVRALNERAKKGVDIRVIGSVAKRATSPGAAAQRLPVAHPHDRLRPARSLCRQPEPPQGRTGCAARGRADRARQKVLSGLLDTFEADWGVKASDAAGQSTPQEIKKARKATVVKLSPLDPLVKQAVDDVVQQDGPGLTVTEVKKTVEKAVKEAVRERVQEILNEAWRTRTEDVPLHR